MPLPVIVLLVAVSAPSEKTPPPDALAPVVTLPLTVLLVSATVKPQAPPPTAPAPEVLLPLTVLRVSVAS